MVAQWEMVDEGWGRRAVEWATIAEPGCSREYVAVHHHLGIDEGTRLLDMACGSGLALELAVVRGASCAGIDASPRLVDVARHRVPDADVRVGDMGALPWDDESFDVVTSFRGIWGTTPGAVREAHRVLTPGGRLSLTCYGNVKRSSGAWVMSPFRWADQASVEHQGEMNELGWPGVGEQFLTDQGFDADDRIEVPFVLEFPDPRTFARAMAASGPGYESIQAIGEEEFLARAEELGRQHVVDGLPLRAEVQVFCFVGTKR